MTRAVTRTWYRIALARAGAAPVLVAASGEHLGAAVAAAEHHVAGSWAIAAELASADQVPLGESVGRHQVATLDEVPAQADALPVFRWPSGVLPRLGRIEGVRGVRRGYAIHPARPGERLLAIEAQTDGEHLVDLFLGIIERLPSADNLEVRLLEHFPEHSPEHFPEHSPEHFSDHLGASGRTDVWLTSRVNAKKILRFLDDFDVELIGNGHVELSVYVRAHRATLRLTEHKTVVWIAEERALEAEVTGWLRELGVPRIAPLVTAAAAPHFHYRPGKSRDRKKLSEELYRQRLRRVDTVERRPAAAAASAPPAVDDERAGRDTAR
jgi:hypothetical protein